jgi:site-specific recombinase XerD
VFTLDGKPASEGDIRRKLIRIAKLAGVANLISTHARRRTFGSMLAESGVTLPIVQCPLGHTEIRTTMIYLHTAEEEHSEAIEV